MKRTSSARGLVEVVAACGLGAALFASAAKGTVGNLYVTEEGPGNVLQFNGITGAPVGFFTPSPLAGNVMAIHTGGAVGDVLVGTALGGGVKRLDRNTGATVQTYGAGNGWQWAGVWRPSANTVLVGSMASDDIREYDADTGAYLGTFATGVGDLADMVYGPNGNLFACSYQPGGGVYEIDAVTGAVINLWGAGGVGMGFANDIIFMPDGRRIVTSMTDNKAHVFDSAWNPITTFAGTGWGRIHGIALSPHDGRIYAIDGLTTNVHSFDPVTYAEIDANFSSTFSKPVDLEFRPEIPAPGAAVIVGVAGFITVGRRRRRQVGSDGVTSSLCRRATYARA